MLYPRFFDEAATSAEQAAAIDNFNDEFINFHTEHISPIEARIHVGAISLLAAAGTKVDGTVINAAYGNRTTYSTGFLLAGELTGDSGQYTAPVVKIETDINDSRAYDKLLNKSFQRDRRITPARVAAWHIGRITRLLQEVPVYITTGTITNHPVDNGRHWKPFTQTTSHQSRPSPSTPESVLDAGYMKRRLFGNVLHGFYAPDTPFAAPDTKQLESLPRNVLPTLEKLTTPEQIIKLANSSIEVRTQFLETYLVRTIHNEKVARAVI